MPRYTLEPYTGPGSRYHCPECESRDKTFSRYIDTTTGEHLADHTGKCDRLNNCAYHYTPKQFFSDNPDNDKAAPYISGNRPKNLIKRTTPLPASHVPQSLFKGSLQPGKPLAAIAAENTLIAFLIDAFGEDAAAHLTARYFIGTSKHWPDATVFWQIDTAGRIRAGKIIQYLTGPGPTFTGQDCKRNKDNKPAVQWVHKIAKLEGFNLAQCLFGEHLLSREPDKPVGLVESEKTALIASAYFPEILWLACGGLEHLNTNLCKALAGRSVTLFPDLNGLERWQTKSLELSAFCACRVSDLLERKASEADRAAGLDLADFLLREPLTPPTPSLPIRLFGRIWDLHALTTPPAPSLPEITESVPKSQPVLYPITEGWQEELDALEAFFAEFELPEYPVKVAECETIHNPATYIPEAIALIRQHHGSRIYNYHLERLHRLKDLFIIAEVAA